VDRNDKVFTLLYIPKVLYKIVMHKKMSHPADEIQNTFVTFNETRH